MNRELEALPMPKEIRRRIDAGMGLTSPELATLMAHVKLALKADLLGSELPDQEAFAARLPRYFPSTLRDRFAADTRSHQLRREIVTTMLVNDVVDTSGITYAYRITEDAGWAPSTQSAASSRSTRSSGSATCGGRSAPRTCRSRSATG